MGKFCRYFLFFSCLFFSVAARGQDTRAKAESFPAPSSFISPDSDLIGSPIQYTLFVRHPARSVVLFPDSAYPYDPFEFRSKIAFPSRLGADSMVLDCCWYELASFSLEPAIRLQLPVFYITPDGDSLPVYSPEATLYQRFMSRNRDSSYADTLLASTQALPVPERINYPYIGLGIFLILAIILLANLFLGRPIERWLKLAVLGRRHRFFIRAFEKLVEQIEARKDPDRIERALNLWKTYIERLDEVPYSTYTTSDFAREIPDSSLMKSLHTIDRWVYGGFKPESVENVFTVLKRFSIRMYSRKREEVRNG